MSLLARYKGDYPPSLWAILALVWERGGLACQSDWARSSATEISLAASLGWLSTIAPGGETYSNRWRLTPAGLQALDHKEHFIS